MIKLCYFITQIGMIGLPTNVMHTGHAANMKEAQNVIEKLIRGESVEATLPQPLMPLNGNLMNFNLYIKIDYRKVSI